MVSSNSYRLTLIHSYTVDLSAQINSQPFRVEWLIDDAIYPGHDT